jgi:hypothetical protein
MTDQTYVSKFVEQNLAENQHHHRPPASSSRKLVATGSKSRKGATGKSHHHAEGASGAGAGADADPVRFATLDWETDEVTAALTGTKTSRSFSVVLACDCIYNEALVEPFVSTCADVCRLRSDDRSDESPEHSALSPCVCVVAQQLRDPEVFELWLDTFLRFFCVWRVPDSLLVDGLRSNSGFVVHIGILRGDWEGVTKDS